MSDGIFIGAGAGGAAPKTLDYRRANRHGLIAGATGTGKTVTLQGLVEGFSAAGVPSFVADVKGDLAGLAMPGNPTSRSHAVFAARTAEIDQQGWRYEGCPVRLWDLYGAQGLPIRATVSEMGPVLLARMLGLNAVQEGVLTIAFHVADQDGLLLYDLDDLQALLSHCAERAGELTTSFGNVSKQSVGAIQRALLQLCGQGGEHFFGEPALAIADLLAIEDGKGVVSILAADRLMASPKLYSTFLLWLLSELFEQLPEVGDLDRPKLVFFFDEAHLLFEDAPEALLDKVEQVVRLIRSKGVGVYFITQSPIDIPEAVAGQLGNRVQHALRAFTPRDQKAIRAAAQTFRANPGVDVATAITELKVGEALVSLLQPDGSPSPVERTLIKAPASRVGPLSVEERRALVESDSLAQKYSERVDSHSAEEMLREKAERATVAAEAKAEALSRSDAEERPSTMDKMIQSAGRAAASSIGRQVANEIGRAVLGGGRRRSSGGLMGGLLRGVLGNLLK